MYKIRQRHFRELRRSSVKRWLLSISDNSDNDNIEKKDMLKKLTQEDRNIITGAGLRLQDVDVLSRIEHQGSIYESGNCQVVLHGRSFRQHFGHLKFIIRKKSTRQVVLLVFELTVNYVAHLGLHKLYPDDTTPILINFEDLTTSEPLNFYTSRDYNGEIFNYVALKEALILK